MPKIRLNKAVKEFNISMFRLVEFLQSKGFEVEGNPNAQLEEKAYSALEAEFAKDGEQRKASHEVVITKVPEEKLEIEPKKPEVIKAKAPAIGEAKVLGKIDLESKPAAEAKVEEEKPVEPAPATIIEPKKEEKPSAEDLENEMYKRQLQYDSRGGSGGSYDRRDINFSLDDETTMRRRNDGNMGNNNMK